MGECDRFSSMHKNISCHLFLKQLLLIRELFVNTLFVKTNMGLITVKEELLHILHNFVLNDSIPA